MFLTLNFGLTEFKPEVAENLRVVSIKFFVFLYIINPNFSAKNRQLQEQNTARLGKLAKSHLIKGFT